MSFPAWLLKSTWIPNSSLELSICSTASLLLLFCFPAAMAGSPLLSFPLLTASADLIISLLISSITSSSCSMAGSLYAVFSTALLLPQWVDLTRSPMPSLFPLWHSSGHSAADSSSAVSSY
jgi:hypothetical protein